jgi:hypothetical protein
VGGFFNPGLRAKNIAHRGQGYAFKATVGKNTSFACQKQLLFQAQGIGPHDNLPNLPA